MPARTPKACCEVRQRLRDRRWRKMAVCKERVGPHRIWIRLRAWTGSAVVDTDRATTSRTACHTGNADGRERTPHHRVGRGEDALETRYRCSSHDIDPAEDDEAHRRRKPD